MAIKLGVEIIIFVLGIMFSLLKTIHGSIVRRIEAVEDETDENSRAILQDDEK